MYTSPYATYLYLHTATLPPLKLKTPSEGDASKPNLLPPGLPPNSPSEDLDWKLRLMPIRQSRTGLFRDLESSRTLPIRLLSTGGPNLTLSSRRRITRGLLPSGGQDFKQRSKIRTLKNRLLKGEPGSKPK